MIVISVLAFVLSTNAFACLCTPFISESFRITSQTIQASLQAQIVSLQALKRNIEKANENLIDQIQILDKENNVLKAESVRDSELIFYLKQKNNLR